MRIAANLKVFGSINGVLSKELINKALGSIALMGYSALGVFA